MGQGLKQRLLGAVVLTGLLIILAPALFRGGEDHPMIKVELPPLSEAPEVPVFVEDLVTPADETGVIDREQLVTDVNEEDTTPGTDDQGHLKVWTLQLASFSDKSNADKLVEQLKDDGLAGYSKRFNREGGSSLYRVYVGPEARTRELLALRDRLQKELGMTGMVVRFKP